MRHLLYIFISTFLFTSCTKEVDLNLEDKSGEIVIEGNITNQAGSHTVKITRTVAFTTSSQYPAISNAFVTISDDLGFIDTLVYTSNGEYKTKRLVSEPGRTYLLTVNVNNKVYTASSKMPKAVPFDGLMKDSVSFGGEVNFTLLPVFIDPLEIGNRYFFITHANGKREKIFEVFSDNINNGIPNQRIIFLAFNNTDTDIKIEKGDSITVEMQCITNDIYTYYNSIIQLTDGGPGGGVTPSNPPSNISNGALGYFSAHSVAYKSIVL